MPPRNAAPNGSPSKKAQIMEQYQVHKGDAKGAHERLGLYMQDDSEVRIINILERLSTGRIDTTIGYADAVIILQELGRKGDTGALFTTLREIQAKSKTLELGADRVRREHAAEIKKKDADIEKNRRLYEQLLAEKEEWARSKQAQAAKDLKFEQMKADLERVKRELEAAQRDRPALLELQQEFDKMQREYDAFKRTTGQGEAEAVIQLRQQVDTLTAKITQLESLVAAGETAKKDLEARLKAAETASALADRAKEELGIRLRTSEAEAATAKENNARLEAAMVLANKAKEDSEEKFREAQSKLVTTKAKNAELEALVANLEAQLAVKPAVVVAAPAPVAPAVVNPDISEQLDRMEEKLQDFDKISAQLEALKLQLAEAQQKLLEAQGESERALLEERQKLQLALEKCAADKGAAQAALNEQFAAIIAALKEAAANRESGGSGRSEPVVVKAATTAATQYDLSDFSKSSRNVATNTDGVLEVDMGTGDGDSKPPITGDPINFEAMLTAVAATMFPRKEAASAAATNGQKNQVFKSFVRGLSEALNDDGGREDSTSRKAFDAMIAQIIEHDPKKTDFIASLNNDEGFRNQFLTWADGKAQKIKESSTAYNKGYDHSEFEPLYEKYNRSSPTSSPTKPIISWQVSRMELDLKNIRGKIS